MASEGPAKSDILAIFKRLRSAQTNKMAFFRQHGCTSTDAQQKYHSRAAQMYREKLHSMALKAMKQYGTKIHIDNHHNTDSATPSPRSKDVDFFKEHDLKAAEKATDDATNGFSTRSNVNSAPISIANGNNGTNGFQKNDEPEDPTAGPNVDAALSMSPTQAVIQAEPRKVTIGNRKPTGAKKGLGGKKSLGAQKVKANFNDIENAAQLRDKERDQLAAMAAAQEAHTKEEESKKMANMKLAYKDLSLESKRRDEQFKKLDPKKKEQVERLGMGFGGSRESSHSAISEMTVIEQQAAPAGPRTTLDSLSSRRPDFEDDFELISGFSSGPPKYNESPFGMKSEDKYSSWSNSSSKSNWDSGDRYDSKQSGGDTNTIEEISSHNRSSDNDRGRARKNFDTSEGDAAVKKFGNAKAISSDAYFGKYDADSDMQQKLSNYQGSTGISSDDLFGRGGGGGGGGGRQNYSSYGSGSGGGGTDLSDIKEGVRHGVTKVAGKLSNLTNSVINSIQDHYG